MKSKIITSLSALMLLLTVATTNVAQAQSYNKALGINVGAIMGANFKHFINADGAIEYDFGYQLPGNGIMLTAVYQHHFNLVENLNLYVGGGLNIGAKYLGNYNGASFAIGIDPTVGIEYRINNSPIVFAFDYTPQLNFTTTMNWSIAAFKIRFVL